MPKTSIPLPDLKQLAKKRLQEAEVLLVNGKYEGAVYLCGYAVELALKARICKTLKWTIFPDPWVQNPQTLTTHDLSSLLSLSGMRPKVFNKYKSEWSTIANWKPEMRYVLNPDILNPTLQPQTQTTQQLAQQIFNSVKTLLRIL
jgi:hypothetical protein